MLYPFALVTLIYSVKYNTFSPGQKNKNILPNNTSSQQGSLSECEKGKYRGKDGRGNRGPKERKEREKPGTCWSTSDALECKKPGSFLPALCHAVIKESICPFNSATFFLSSPVCSYKLSTFTTGPASECCPKVIHPRARVERVPHLRMQRVKI